jgi:hypothetical protein
MNGIGESLVGSGPLVRTFGAGAAVSITRVNGADGPLALPAAS